MNNTDSSNFLHRVLSAEMSDYLRLIGMVPLKEEGNLAYYKSPFQPHENENPELILNRNTQIWKCNASGKKGNIIDFGTALYKCSIPMALDHFRVNLPIPENAIMHPEAQDRTRYAQLKTLEEKPITEKKYEQFFKHHGMDLNFVSKLCSQYTCIDKVTGEELTAISLRRQQDVNHFLLVDDHLPKKSLYMGSDVSNTPGHAFANLNSLTVDVFTSMMDLLHHQHVFNAANLPRNNILLLTEDFTFEPARSIMESHKQVNLYLPNTHRSDQYKGYAEWLSPKYKDFSHTYAGKPNLSHLLNSNIKLERNQKKGRGKRGNDGL